jgi:hypothetical protein
MKCNESLIISEPNVLRTLAFRFPIKERKEQGSRYEVNG